MIESDPSSPAEDLLHRFLADRDAPCPVCGYNLRASMSCRCPECGSRVDLCLGSFDLGLGPWVATIAAATTLIGFVAFFFAVMLIDLAIAGYWWPENPSLITFLVIGLCSVCFLGCVIVKRRRFFAMRQTRQWLWAFCSWLGALLAGIVLMVVFFVYEF
jgi:hypothetical protein